MAAVALDHLRGPATRTLHLPRGSLRPPIENWGQSDEHCRVCSADKDYWSDDRPLYKVASPRVAGSRGPRGWIALCAEHGADPRIHAPVRPPRRLAAEDHSVTLAYSLPGAQPCPVRRHVVAVCTNVWIFDAPAEADREFARLLAEERAGPRRSARRTSTTARSASTSSSRRGRPPATPAQRSTSPVTSPTRSSAPPSAAPGTSWPAAVPRSSRRCEVFFPYNPFNHGLGLDARRLRRANALVEAVERLGDADLQRRMGERFRMEVRPYVKLGRAFWLPLMINERTGESRMMCWCDSAALAEEEIHVLALLRIYSPKSFLRAWRKMDDPDDQCDCWLDPDFVSCEHSLHRDVSNRLFSRAHARTRRRRAQPCPAGLPA